jgi:hypothetical protein
MKKAPKILSKDAKKYLNISVDLRTKAFRDFVATHGGFESAIEAIQVRLNELPEYNKKKSIRTKQIVVQKKYNETTKKYRYIGNIFVEYEITEDRDQPRDSESAKKIAKLIAGVEEDNQDFEKLPRFYPNKRDRTVYRITVNIRFDEFTGKSKISEIIKGKVEKKRIAIYKMNNYIINVEVKSIKEDIHQYKNGTNLENIKMKDADANMIDGYDNQEWDTKTGKCVFDYIINQYKTKKGFEEVCNYEKLNNIFKNFEDEDCLLTGVDTLQIIKFCSRFKLPMYALDDDEKTLRLITQQQETKMLLL